MNKLQLNSPSERYVWRVIESLKKPRKQGAPVEGDQVLAALNMVHGLESPIKEHVFIEILLKKLNVREEVSQRRVVNG